MRGAGKQVFKKGRGKILWHKLGIRMSRAALCILVVLSLSLTITGCFTSNAEKDHGSVGRSGQGEENLVEVQRLELANFQKHILSNGKLKALRKSVLGFNVAGEIQFIAGKNGQRVGKGEVIARLDPFEYELKLRQAQNNFEKSRLELEDILIGQGYELADSASLPEGLFKTTAIKSGYASAKEDLSEARFQARAAELRAPFAGVLADITQKTYETANTSEPFCTFIDDSKFEIEFYLAEGEVQDVRVGDRAELLPFAHKASYPAMVSEINPVVNEHGLVMAKAVVDNPGTLMEGMNMRVVVEKGMPGQLVVPKLAVVLRQNKEVLFKFKSGEAHWVYIKTLFENNNAFAIAPDLDRGGELAPGDTIIVSGNLNLAHESKVTLVTPKKEQ